MRPIQKDEGRSGQEFKAARPADLREPALDSVLRDRDTLLLQDVYGVQDGGGISELIIAEEGKP